jgi:hypothetical protein
MRIKTNYTNYVSIILVSNLYSIKLLNYHIIISLHFSSPHYHITTSPHYHITTLSHHYITTLSHHHITTLSHHHIITSPHYHITTLSHHHIITSPHHHIITSPHHHITTSPHHHITTLSHHHITTSPHHHITTSPHHHITTLSHHHIITSTICEFCNIYQKLCNVFVHSDYYLCRDVKILSHSKIIHNENKITYCIINSVPVFNACFNFRAVN